DRHGDLGRHGPDRPDAAEHADALRQGHHRRRAQGARRPRGTDRQDKGITRLITGRTAATRPGGKIARGTTMKRLSGLMLAAAVSTAALSHAFAADWYPYDAAKIEPPFSADGKSVDVSYVPLEKAEKPWNICVSFPHMKDAYWLGVGYGVAEEAARLGVKMNIAEAGGYTELAKQISQIEDCVASGAEAVVIGAISLDGLNNLVSEV